MESHKKLKHSISACNSSKTDQNQNEESLYPHSRMTKSASWFNSISRKTSGRKTPSKKRSFAFGSNMDYLNLPTTARPRLHKSDWDMRHTESSPANMSFTSSEGTSSSMFSGSSLKSTVSGSSSRSSDCLDCHLPAGSFSRSADPADTSESDLSSSHVCNCCECDESVTSSRLGFHDSLIGENTPASETQRLVSERGKDKMRKYHAVIRLNSSTTSCSDMSTLNLTNLDNVLDDSTRKDLDLVLDVPDNRQPTTYYTIDSRRASKHKKSQNDRRLLHGIKQFNLDPSKGLKYLEDAGFLDMTSEAVAKFLFRQERLSKKQIGNYLGSHNEFNKEVLSKFVHCHEFTRLLLVQALRQFLWSFRLPGEAMQIDRVMDAFAAHYCSQNPELFEERDTCFILSFSIIMLNTALHNPNAKIKITAEQFVKQNKGINSGRDLDPHMLEAIFRNIKEEPFKIPDETYDDLMYTFFSPEREGWLLKQGGSWKNWKRRWFVLNDRCLYYFQHTAENVPKGIIPLENVKVRPLEAKDGKQFAFEIYSEMTDIVKGCKTDSHGTVVQGNHKHYRMSAASEEDRNEWIQCIQDCIEDNPFAKIISDKKAAIRRRSAAHVGNKSREVVEANTSFSREHYS